MNLSRISPRIILALAIIIIAIVVAFRSWSKDMLSTKMLIAAALFLIGLHLLWMELHHARGDHHEGNERNERKKRNGHKDDCGCDECKGRHHEVLNSQQE